MRILSLNGNGIRASIKKGLVRWWETTQADLLLFQEVRFEDADFLAQAFPGCWTSLHSAAKKGYSGVAVISKRPPLGFPMAWAIPNTIRRAASCGLTFRTSLF